MVIFGINASAVAWASGPVATSGDSRSARSDDIFAYAWIKPTANATPTVRIGGAVLTLVADDVCYSIGATVTVTVEMTAAPVPIVGGQFFLAYDAALDFVDIQSVDAPFTNVLHETVNETARTIDYAVGVPNGSPGTTADSTLATITFETLSESCDTAGLVSFRPHDDPPARLSDEVGNEVIPALNDLTTVTISAGPQIDNMPADATYECDEVVPPAPATLPASDNCDPGVTEAAYDGETTIPGSCPQNFAIVRTWTATNDCGVATTATQTITVQDTTGPQVLGVPADDTVECDAVPAPPATLPATDNCDASVTEAAYDGEELTPGSCPQAYTLTRSWSATDACGNSDPATQVLTVEDTTPPVVDCPADLAVECGDSIDPADTGTATATDNCDTGPIAVTYLDDNVPGDCSIGVTITRTWTGQDACGNEGTCDQIITVVVIDPPSPDDYDKLRYVSFYSGYRDPGSLGVFYAYRVKSTTYPDLLAWAGEPDVRNASYLLCTPHYRDDWGVAPIHVGDQQIVPEAQYLIQAIRMGDDIMDEGAYSDPVVINTLIKWGDVVTAFNGVDWGPPNGDANFHDITASVKGFQSDPLAPPWPLLDLHNEIPNRDVNFGDISEFVKGFQGQGYPFSPPEVPCSP